MGDAVGFSVEGLGLGERGMVGEEFEQRADEEVASLGGAGGSFLEPTEFHLIGGPVGARGSPCIGDLILDLGAGFEAEVLGRLVGSLAALDGVEDVGGKDGAFEADGGVHGEESGK